MLDLEEITWLALGEAIAFAQHIQSPTYSNAVIDAMLMKIQEVSDSVPCLDTINVVFDSTHRGSSARLLLAHVWFTFRSAHDRVPASEVHSDFLDLIYEAPKTLKVWEIWNLMERNLCLAYHEHENEQEYARCHSLWRRREAERMGDGRVRLRTT